MALDVASGEMIWDFSVEAWADDNGLSPDELTEWWQSPAGPIVLGDTVYAWAGEGHGMFALQAD